MKNMFKTLHTYCVFDSDAHDLETDVFLALAACRHVYCATWWAISPTRAVRLDCCSDIATYLKVKRKRRRLTNPFKFHQKITRWQMDKKLSTGFARIHQMCNLHIYEIYICQIWSQIMSYYMYPLVYLLKYKKIVPSFHLHKKISHHLPSLCLSTFSYLEIWVQYLQNIVWCFSLMICEVLCNKYMNFTTVLFTHTFVY